MMERLVAVGHSWRELDNLSNANIRAVYEKNRPRLEERAIQLQEVSRIQSKREKRRKVQIARIQGELRNQEIQAQWVARLQPIKPIITQAPRAGLYFGLSAFIAYCKEAHRLHGDRDAAATLRILFNPRFKKNGASNGTAELE